MIWPPTLPVPIWFLYNWYIGKEYFKDSRATPKEMINTALQYSSVGDIGWDQWRKVGKAITIIKE